MTRTTRRYLISRLASLGGSRRIWARWIRACYLHHVDCTLYEGAYGSIDTEAPGQATIRDVRDVLKGGGTK